MGFFFLIAPPQKFHRNLIVWILWLQLDCQSSAILIFIFTFGISRIQFEFQVMSWLNGQIKIHNSKNSIKQDYIESETQINRLKVCQICFEKIVISLFLSWFWDFVFVLKIKIYNTQTSNLFMSCNLQTLNKYRAYRHNNFPLQQSM